MNENYWKTLWSKDHVKAMLLEQFDSFWEREAGVPRIQLQEVEQARSLPHAVIISGLRRAGKSTLLLQLAHRLGRDQFYYLNFEDDRFLGFQVHDTDHLYQILIELFGERRIFIIDEIQNIDGWEHFVRRFMDLGFKFYITGSNASLLSRELGTRLTGRYVPVELFPFSFREYIQFQGMTLPEPGRMKTADVAHLQNTLQSYMQSGGIPDAIKYPKLPILRTLYDDVLYRGIATRYRLESATVIKELALYLMSNPASLVSYNRLKEQFRLGSVNTIKNYIGYMENSWLFFMLNVYDYSLKRQQIAPKKVYAIDTGLIQTVGFGFSPNTGRLLENLVFLELRRRNRDIHYFSSQGGYEVDFYLPEQRLLVQVAQHLNHPETRERELRALKDAIGTVKVKQALILTNANDETFRLEGVPVDIRSTAEWLLTG